MPLRAVAALAVVLILWPTGAGAGTISREEAVDYALAHSDLLTARRQESAALAATGRQVSAFVRPQISASGQWLELGTNATEMPIPMLKPFFKAPERDITAGIEVSQVLFAGFRIPASLRLEKSLAGQAALGADAAEREVLRQVKGAFDAVLLSRASLAVLQDRAEQARAEHQDAQDLYDAGVVTSLDVRQARLGLNITADALRRAEAELIDAALAFNQALGRPTDEETLVPEGDLETAPDMEDLVGRLTSRTGGWDFPDLALARSREKSALQQKRMAGGGRFPEVAAVAGARTSGEETGLMDESWSVGLTARWDLYDGGLVRAGKAEASANLLQARAALEAGKKQIHASVERIRADNESLDQRIALARETVELSRENYEDARGHYRAGTITITRLGEFSVAFAEARFNLISLFFSKRLLAAEAEALLGAG
ncbi:MAG: TolC family protein [Proteobacteria bacterium]|nr:TolC family protein [Pseudomonadota bacterium]